MRDKRVTVKLPSPKTTEKARNCYEYSIAAPIAQKYFLKCKHPLEKSPKICYTQCVDMIYQLHAKKQQHHNNMRKLRILIWLQDFYAKQGSCNKIGFNKKQLAHKDGREIPNDLYALSVKISVREDEKMIS